MLRQPPAKLLGDFKAVGLGPFGVIRAEIDVDDRPAILVGDLGAEAVDIVIVPANADHVGPEDQRAKHFALLQVVRNHDKAADARLGGVGGGAVGEIARAGAADGVKAKFHRLADRHRHHPLFVGIRRIVARIVLDPQFLAAQFLRQPIGPLQAA